MTEKLFYADSHLDSMEAVVLACEAVENGYAVILDRTVFFPEGGGQPADTGIIAGIRVTDVQEQDGLIRHILTEPIAVGSQVSGRLDWDRRFSCMQNHSGEHIVSGLVHSRFGYSNVGFHMGSEAVTMDFNGRITADELKEVELQANRIVTANLRITADFPEPDELSSMKYRSKIEIDGPVRIVTIPGVDRCACCAPHVSFTGEIGIIKLIGSERYKGGTRVSMLCGFRALKDYEKRSEQIAALSVRLSSKPDDVAEAVERLMLEMEGMKEKKNRLQRELYARRAEDETVGRRNLLAIEEDLTPAELRYLANAYLERLEGVAAVFTGDEQQGYQYVIGSGDRDCRELGKSCNRALNGRGGGSAQMVQGSVKAGREEIEKWFADAVQDRHTTV
jgi:alanyl-tRNA synthetase